MSQTNQSKDKKVLNRQEVLIESNFLQSKSSLDQMESQSADAEPPPPPKPDLRYPGLLHTEAEGQTFSGTSIQF